MSALGTVARFIVPVALPAAFYYSKEVKELRWRGQDSSQLYPLPAICVALALVLLLSISAGWVSGAPSTSKDICYLLLVTLIVASLFIDTADVAYRRLLANTGIFLVAFIIYSGASGNEAVLLAPAVCLALLDAVLAVEAVSTRMTLARLERSSALKTL